MGTSRDVSSGILYTEPVMTSLNYHPDALEPEARDQVRRFCTVDTSPRKSVRSQRLLDAAERLTVETSYGPVVVWDWGPDDKDCPIALLCHGWSDSAATWVAFHGPLQAAGFRVVAFDQPAHGATAELTGVTETIFTRMMAATSAVLAWSRQQGRVGALIGHSVGALGAFLSACESDPARLVCIAMPPAVPWFIDYYADAISLDTGIRDEFMLHLRFRFHEDMGVDYHPEQIDSVRRAADIAMPVLFIQDEADRDVPIEASHRTVEAVRNAGGDVESFDTEKLGHQLLLRSPVVISRILDFLK